MSTTKVAARGAAPGDHHESDRGRASPPENLIAETSL